MQVYYVLLLTYSLRKGVQSSGVQFVFWLLITICQCVRFRTVVANRFDVPTDVLSYVIEVTYLPIVVAMLLVNCWADVRPKYTMETQTSEVCSIVPVAVIKNLPTSLYFKKL